MLLAVQQAPLVKAHHSRAQIAPSPACRRACTISLQCAAQRKPLALGLDFGTSGARGTVVDADAQVVEEQRCSYPEAPAEKQADAWAR